MLNEQELDDIKLMHLLQYKEYGYSDQQEMDDVLEKVFVMTYSKHLLPIIGSELYSKIQAKALDDYTAKEIAVYEAEIRFAAFEFLQIHARREQQFISQAQHSVNFGGVTFVHSGLPGKAKVMNRFLEEAVEWMGLAGYIQETEVSSEGIMTRWTLKPDCDTSELYGGIH